MSLKKVKGRVMNHYCLKGSTFRTAMVFRIYFMTTKKFYKYVSWGDGVCLRTTNPKNQEAEAGGSLCVQG